MKHHWEGELCSICCIFLLQQQQMVQKPSDTQQQWKQEAQIWGAEPQTKTTQMCIHVLSMRAESAPQPVKVSPIWASRVSLEYFPETSKGSKLVGAHSSFLVWQTKEIN